MLSLSTATVPFILNNLGISLHFHSPAFHELPTEHRQMHLGFVCECEACVLRYPLKSGLRNSKVKMPRLVHRRLDNPKEEPSKALENMQIFGEHLTTLDSHVASSDWVRTNDAFEASMLFVYEKENWGFIAGTSHMDFSVDGMGGPSE